MNISPEAAIKINRVIENNPGKFPRIVLKSGGCAGHRLFLELGPAGSSDTVIESHGIKFAIPDDVLSFLDDISISIKPGLGEELVVQNLKAPTCKCGNSFRL